MVDEMTLDELRQRAARVGLNLSEEELIKILPGVHRSHKQVNELRAIFSAADEPAVIFRVASSHKE